MFPRGEFGANSWSDSTNSGQLIDHFEKSLTLSPLELIAVTLIVYTIGMLKYTKPATCRIS